MTTEQMEELKNLLVDLEGECARVGVLLDNCEKEVDSRLPIALENFVWDATVYKYETPIIEFISKILEDKNSGVV